MMTSINPHLPRPSGWRILVKTYSPPEKVGSLYMPAQVVDMEKVATLFGQVVELGPIAYKDDKFHGIPWCKEEDYVVLSKYSGTKFKLGEDEFRIINDDEVQGTVIDPSVIKRV